jgi:hypothetical protein
MNTIIKSCSRALGHHPSLVKRSIDDGCVLGAALCRRLDAQVSLVILIA